MMVPRECAKEADNLIGVDVGQCELWVQPQHPQLDGRGGHAAGHARGNGNRYDVMDHRRFFVPLLAGKDFITIRTDVDDLAGPAPTYRNPATPAPSVH